MARTTVADPRERKMQYGIYLSSEIAIAISDIAKERGASFSQVVGEVMAEWLRTNHPARLAPKSR